MSRLRDRPSLGRHVGGNEGSVPVCTTTKSTFAKSLSCSIPWTPCPYYERDLDADAEEEYIVESAHELRDHKASAIIVHVDKQ
jgi:hypothetical protein